MFDKTKIKNTNNKINQIARQSGLIILAAAATLGMIDTPDHLNSRINVPNQPAFAWVNNNLELHEQGNNLQREREDIAPHYIDFSVVQRTAARSGKQ
jgi:hypothetical protein